MRMSIKRSSVAVSTLGIAAAAALALAPSASASTTAPYIRYGSSGNGVWCVQYALNTQGYNLTEDSKFGPKTLAAVKSFQRHTYLHVDGIVGPLTGDEIVGADSSFNAAWCDSVVPTS